MTDDPKPTEVWGLYDANGKLRETTYIDDLANWWAHEVIPDNDGWTIRRVRVEPGDGWRPMSEAPKDGTRVLLWVVHPSARYSKDAIGDGYAAPVIAYWTDHNSGGWVWHGVGGEFTAWQPLPAPPVSVEPGTEVA